MIKPGLKQYPRSLGGQAVPSYLLWVLRNAKWLPLANGERERPSMCILARNVSKEVSALVRQPYLNSEHPLLENLKIDKIALKNALSTVGVVTELDELPWDSFYEVLLELPEKDPKGEVAQSLYRALIARQSDSDNPSGEKHDTFMKEGRMFGRFCDETGYFPISKLYYFENPTLPQPVLNLFHSLELDKHKGAAKVKRFFGVQPFSLSEADIKLISFEEHPQSDIFRKDVESLKPYIYALRVEEDSDRSELRSLKQLQVILCTSAKCSIRIGNEEKEMVLQSGESIIADSIIYMVVEQSDYDKQVIKDEIVADALGSIVTGVLKVEIGGDIARLATCSDTRLRILLNKITGGSGEVRLEKGLALMQLPLDLEEEFVKPSTPMMPIPPEPTHSSIVGEVEPISKPSEARSPTIGPVNVSGGSQLPIGQQREVKQRVKVNLELDGFISARRIVDPDRTENLAMQFEEAQHRFPLKVSHLQGKEAYGCDILSFGNKENLEAFKTTHEMKLIDRFIEVKGSVNDKGAITLKGYELACANENRDKFFLYRVCETEKTGEFKLVETQNPLLIGEKNALSIQYEINPFKTKRSKQWVVTEINEEEQKEDVSEDLEKTP